MSVTPTPSIPPVDRLFDHVLMCPICLDNIGTEPKTLRQCGHTLCHNCYVKQSMRQEVIKCPTCRTQTYIGEGTRGGPVAINQMLKNAVEFIQTNRQNLKRLNCKLCNEISMDTILCESCCKKEAKKAEIRAKPRYLYEYEHKSALDVVMAKRQKVRGKIEVCKTSGKASGKTPEMTSNESKKEEKKIVEDENNAFEDIGPGCKLQ